MIVADAAVDAPKEVFRCDAVGCGDTFVRSDLFARHKSKHHDKSATGTEHQISSTTNVARNAVSAGTQAGGQTTTLPSPGLTRYGVEPNTDVHFASHLGGDDYGWMPSLQQSGITQGQAQDQDLSRTDIPPQVAPLDTTTAVSNSWASGHCMDGDMEPMQLNFANWLLHPPNSRTGDYGLPNFPYLDYSLEYSPPDGWGMDPDLDPENPAPQSYRFNPNVNRPPRGDVRSETLSSISESLMSSVARTLGSFLNKKRPDALSTIREGSLLSSTDHCTFPNITTLVLERYLTAFWCDVARQMPIVHRPTFDANNCRQHLLLAILALGAAQLVRRSPEGLMDDHKALADLIMINLRWDILTDDGAQPPMQLWAAQALLLLELYEKMYSTRSLHERAHIHHASTITLLRRGSPLVARDESETPPSGMPTRCGTPEAGIGGSAERIEDDGTRLWRRWSRMESMNRVVFAAFQMDALHAVLFGHESALFPYEIRLALPCDETLWAANTPDEVQRLEESFWMHGIRPINFLDGLKRCLHAQEVHSHYHGRNILMAGLLSVSWHLKKREKHLHFLETVPIAEEQERWSSLLRSAYSSWCTTFQQALSGSKSRRAGKGQPQDDHTDPAVLYHLANITARVDIIDLQILAGSRRLLGRKVSTREHTHVASRMKQWAASEASRTAVLHAFKLLHETLLPAASAMAIGVSDTSFHGGYSCRSDSLIYRPWVLYLAALTIWASQHGNSQAVQPASTHVPIDSSHEVAMRYISTCATLRNTERLPLVTSIHGCSAVLRELSEDFANAESELLVEASKRLRQCESLLNGTAL